MSDQPIETLECLKGNRDHARKHLESIADHIQHLQDEQVKYEARYREAQRCERLAQQELENSYPEEA